MEGESSDNQPSTSAAAIGSSDPGNYDGEEKDQNFKQLLESADKVLENKAKSLKLSSLNVRSILHHLIKYPSTIDVLLGIRENDDNLPSVRNMRSRKKLDEPGTSSAINTPEKFSLRIEDKGPKNFLDLEYDEDDEYDEDYVEENNSSRNDGEDAEDSEDEEMDEEEEADDEEEGEDEGGIDEDQQNKSHNESANSSGILENNELDDLLFGDAANHNDEYSLHMTLNDTRPGSAALVQTLDNVIDDDDYQNFVKSIKCSAKEYVPDKQQTIYDTEDDTEDEDYNVIADNLNVDDWDETRQDKTTQIPRHEVKALMMDTLLAEKDIPITLIPEETLDGSKKELRSQMNEVSKAGNSEAELNESCSLLTDGPVRFRPEELTILRTQLEQHVQFLTQFVVTCHHDDELADVRNEAQLMMNDLDNRRQAAGYQTILDTDNLDAAITSCHEINTFPPASTSVLNYASQNGWHVGKTLRPEAAEVLSKSGAIRYPGLLPPCQPIHFEKPIPFLSEEDVMLAVALLQFSHLPRRAEKGMIDRYSMIQQHCLPAREAFKIRNHLKTMRKESKNPIHAILQAAENGICNLTIPAKEWKRIDTPIHTWPVISQPGWYRFFKKTFNVTDDLQIHRKEEATMVMTPRAPSANRVPVEEDPDDFVDIGTGSDGRQIIMARGRIEELMKQLSDEKSSSKRRKNPTPMKLSTMIEMEKRSNNGREQNEPSTSTNQPTTSKAARKISQIQNMPGASGSNSKKPWEIYYSPGEFYHNDNKSNSCNSFPIPPTPGRRSPDEHDDYFMDLETNSLLWSRPPRSVYMGNPQTPRGYSAEPEYNEDDPIDFSSMAEYSICDLDAVRESKSQRPMGYSAEIDDFSHYDYNPDAHCSPPSEIQDAPETVVEADVSGLDQVEETVVYEECAVEEIIEEVVEEVVEEPPVVKLGLTGTRPPLKFAKLAAAGDTTIKASRKRTWAEREAMGSVGFYDKAIYEKQKDSIMRKVIEDISQRLFMHGETLQQFQETIFSDEFSEIEKVSRIMLVLKNHRELLSLILLYAPPEAIVSDYDLNFNASSYKAAVEMIMAIERYVTSSRAKASARTVFGIIQNFLAENPELTDEEAARKFHRMFGRDKALWRAIESNFWCLPFKPKAPPVEQFEYIDLTNMETMTKKDLKNFVPRFETIDSISGVMTGFRVPRNEVPSKLVVRAGEFCILNDDESLTQLEVTERHWTMKDDIRLLKGYNDALKSVPDFEDSMIPTFVSDLPFGPKSIEARLKYLLEELKKMEEEAKH